MLYGTVGIPSMYSVERVFSITCFPKVSPLDTGAGAMLRSA